MENNAKIQYISDGENVVFETPFCIFINEGIDIYFDDQKINSSDYTLVLDNEKRATVTLNQAPNAGVVITIIRVIPFVRVTKFQEGGALRANTLNYEFDYQMACVQDLQDEVSRSMRYPPYASSLSVDLTLPTPEAGKSIVWSADGTSLVNSNVLVNDIEEELELYKEEAEASAIVAQTAANLATEKSLEVSEKADAVIAAIDSKVNANFDNITQEAKKIICEMSVPDYGAKVTIPDDEASSVFVAPANGVVYCKLYGLGSMNMRKTEDATIELLSQDNVASMIYGTSCVVVKGESYTITLVSGAINNTSLQFYPYKGEV